MTSKKEWVISDTHFGHENILSFTDENGVLIRGKHFLTLDDMHQRIIDNWNSLVGDNDRVYMLGDVVIKRKALDVLGHLKGRKVLVKGNHDIFKIKDYLKYFDDVRAYVVRPKDKIIMSHIPIHPESLGRNLLNIHGHLHHNQVLCGVDIDMRYLNVSVEQTEYFPLDLGRIVEWLKSTTNPDGALDK